MTRVLIAGCGDVGTALGLALAADGDQVLGLRRRPERLPAPIVPLRADLVSGAGLADAAAGVGALVYAAAADEFSEQGYRRAYVAGLRNVLGALRAARAPVERVLFTSSTAVYAQGDGSWVDESSPTEPHGFSGRLLLEAEALLIGAGFPATVLRLAGIYGPGRTRLIDEVRSGAATCPDGAPIYTNRIHVADCAGAIRHLLRLPGRAADGIWLGVDHEPCERSVVLDWLADRLAVPRPRRVAAMPAAAPERERGNPAQPRGVAAEAAPGRRLGSNKRCSSAKLVASGYVLRYPTFREGYAAVLATMDAADRPA